MTTKVGFEIELGEDDNYCDYSLVFSTDLGKVTLLFNSKKEELKNFATLCLQENPADHTLYGSGSGDGYCNLQIKSGKIEIDCDPGHGCKIYFECKKDLLHDFAKEVLDF